MTRTRVLDLVLRGVGFACLFALFVANLYLLHDAMTFELGDKLGPACTSIRRAGIHPALLFFLAQLVSLTCLSLYSRSWIVVGLAVFPLWAILYGACMVFD